MNQPCRRQTAAGRFSGNLMTKVTVYFRTIRSGFNTQFLLMFCIYKILLCLFGAEKQVSK